MQDFVETAVEMEPFLNDGNKHVYADGYPDLSLDGIWRCAVERLDPQVLFDPLKEEFHPPTTFV